MIYEAPFPQVPKVTEATTTAACVIGTTNTPTNTQLLATAGAEGAVLTSLTAIPTATLGTASGLYLFISHDNGATQRLIDSELMATYTLSATTKIPKVRFADYTEQTPLRLGAGDRLYVGAATAVAICFKAERTEYAAA